MEYAPVLPENKNPELQENKRKELFLIFQSGENDPKMLQLYDETYPTLRALINEYNRDLSKLLLDWPWIQSENYIISHSSRLLGDNIRVTWNESIEKLIKPIRQYLKFRKLNKNEKEAVDALVKESKNAALITKDKKSNQLLVFKLLIQYFKNSEQNFYRIFDVNIIKIKYYKLI